MTKQIDRQNGEIAFLRSELSEQSKQYDTLLLQITQQLDRTHLQLEDLQKQSLEAPQNYSSLWQRMPRCPQRFDLIYLCSFKDRQ